MYVFNELLSELMSQWQGLDPLSPTEPGRWSSHNTRAKDEWVAEYYERVRKDQVASEKVNGTAQRFHENPDCQAWIFTLSYRR